MKRTQAAPEPAASEREQPSAEDGAPSATVVALMIVAGAVLPVVAAAAFAVACTMSAWL